jgi:TPP-dependent indolepyruvate ferredoxin oxidoreductase alpha subunit
MISATNSVTLFIDDDLCQVCSPCLAIQACKVRAIVTIDREEPPFVDMHRCYGCMLCLKECPFEAVKSSS